MPINRDSLHIHAKNPQVQQAARIEEIELFPKTEVLGKP
jgi:hypothetical protein